MLSTDFGSLSWPLALARSIASLCNFSSGVRFSSSTGSSFTTGFGGVQIFSFSGFVSVLASDFGMVLTGGGSGLFDGGLKLLIGGMLTLGFCSICIPSGNLLSLRQPSGKAATIGCFPPVPGSAVCW